MLKGVDSAEATGLLQNHHRSPEEAAQVLQDQSTPTDEAASEEERANMLTGALSLGSRKQFDDQVLSPHPVVVIRGDGLREFDRLMEAAKKLNDVTAEERKDLMDCRERICECDERL